MGLRINTNVAALNAQRNLYNTTSGLNSTLERLSTGLRINRAADDAAGMAISEGLTSQLRGLKQVVRNTEDAISMVSTAESAIAEQVAISQRMRELSVQAANGAISDYDRANIQKEVDQLLAEFDRIATQTSFNGVALLNGQFGTKDLQVGTEKGQTIRLTLASSRINAIGGVAIGDGAQRDAVAGVLTAITTFEVNDISVTGFTSDGVSDVEAAKSALAVVAAVNALSGSTGVTATSESTVFTAAQAFSAACANFNYTNTADSLVINGVSITGSGSTISDAIDVINNFSNQTGVRATSSGTSIVLEAPDGRNIHLESDASLTGVNNIGILSAATVEKVTAAAVTLTSDNKFKLEDAGGGTTLASIGITSNTYSIDATTTIDTISLLSTSSAGNAIEITDNTLRQLNNLRSKIGALQNRLESTRRNLSTTYENLSAARSRILDADIAVETAEMTKMQILQQAGLAVLAQANMAPQAVLSLLQ
ncbi:MAG: hypothetical protein A2284_18300 [Deltaproteobacteria bacterium RIFOXYA12_FULL_61_11]|nr:MAG: hypothetical protein A2284_18300 [Deltaproteobacteria bacterium RIFOXYA12_FULL_61_11]